MPQEEKQQQPERRSSDAYLLGIVDRRNKDVEIRLADLASERLIAVEKLFNLTLATRADALNVALRRLQADSRNCASRCSNQVKIFYDIVNDHTKKLVELEIHVESNDVRIDSYKVDIAELKAKEEATKLSLLNVHTWKDNFWFKNIASAVVIGLVLIESFLHGFQWIMDFITKVSK